MTIRKATAGDVADIRAIAEDAYAQYVAAIGRKPMPMIADFAAHVAAGEVYVTCASGIHTDTGIDGFIILFPRDDHMFLENVAVRTAAGGKGLGKALIAFCEAQAKKAGLSAVELYTNIKMTSNQTLYPHLGYAETERRTEFGFHRIYYRKDL